jgi:hypothetical protein
MISLCLLISHSWLDSELVDELVQSSVWIFWLHFYVQADAYDNVHKVIRALFLKCSNCAVGTCDPP